MNNPLIEAVHKFDEYANEIGRLMHEVGGCSVLDPYDEALSDEIIRLITDSWSAVKHLSPRASQARLNARWRDFLVKHSAEKKGCKQ